MTGRSAVVIGVALLAATPLFADEAKARGGSSGDSSSAGERHHGGGGASASSRTESGSSSSSSSTQSSSGSSSGRVDLTDAQRRHPRAGTGTGRGSYRDRDGYRDRGGYWGSGGGYYSGYSPRYRRYSYPGYYGYGYDYWYSPYFYSGMYGYSSQYYRGRQRESGSLRLQVVPEKTRVYVDGYYAGIVDDFDGLLQRLYLPPGRHDVTLKLEGHRSHTFKVYVPIDQTIKVHHEMVQGAGDETVDVVGTPMDYARAETRDEGRRRRDYGREDDDDVDDGLDRQNSGSLRLRVRPADASVYVDGKFHGAAGNLESLVLRPGRHRVEVVRPGFRTVEREVEVDRGRSAELEVELEKD